MMSAFKLLMFLMSLTLVGVLLKWNLNDRLRHQDQTLCPREKCVFEGNSMLNHHLNRSVEPFLSAEYNLPEDIFKWWKHLQADKDNLTYYNAVVDKLFEFFPPSPDVEKLSSDSCRTCSVVGNSVNLKGSHYGTLIDYQDFVIRMNAGKVKGYEADVGTKTTHRVMYPESAVGLDNTTHLVLFPFKIRDLEWLVKHVTGFYERSNAPGNFKMKANKDLVMVVNPAFMKYVHEMWLNKKGRYPSTGFMTLILALHICHEVHVFGFGADSDGNWSHYWEKLRNKKLKTGPHAGQHEHLVIQQMADGKRVRFYKGQ